MVTRLRPFCFLLNQITSLVKNTKNLPGGREERRTVIKTPTHPKTGEDWGTPKPWKRGTKPNSKTEPKH